MVIKEMVHITPYHLDRMLHIYPVSYTHLHWPERNMLYLTRQVQ